MMVGAVHPDGEAVVPVRVRGPQGSPGQFQAVVDTGLNDWLTLSGTQIEALALPFREAGRYALADGSEAVTRLLAAEVEWFGRWRRILVVEMEGGPPLGRAMLRGFYLGVEVVDGGRVEIRPLATQVL